MLLDWLSDSRPSQQLFRRDGSAVVSSSGRRSKNLGYRERQLVLAQLSPPPSAKHKRDGVTGRASGLARMKALLRITAK